MPTQQIWLEWSYPGTYPQQGLIIWGSNLFVWSEVYILITIGAAVGGGAGGLLLPKKHPWKEFEKQVKRRNVTQEEADRFLEIVVRVNGLVKSEVRDLKKIKKEITVEHIQKTLTTAFGDNIKVTVTEINKV